MNSTPAVRLFKLKCSINFLVKFHTNHQSFLILVINCPFLGYLLRFTTQLKLPVAENCKSFSVIPIHAQREIWEFVGIHPPVCEYSIKAEKMARFPCFLSWAVYLKMYGVVLNFTQDVLPCDGLNSLFIFSQIAINHAEIKTVMISIGHALF